MNIYRHRKTFTKVLTVIVLSIFLISMIQGTVAKKEFNKRLTNKTDFENFDLEETLNRTDEAFRTYSVLTTRIENSRNQLNGFVEQAKACELSGMDLLPYENQIDDLEADFNLLQNEVKQLSENKENLGFTKKIIENEINEIEKQLGQKRWELNQKVYQLKKAETSLNHAERTYFSNLYKMEKEMDMLYDKIWELDKKILKKELTGKDTSKMEVRRDEYWTQMEILKNQYSTMENQIWSQYDKVIELFNETLEMGLEIIELLIYIEIMHDSIERINNAIIFIEKMEVGITGFEKKIDDLDDKIEELENIFKQKRKERGGDNAVIPVPEIEIEITTIELLSNSIYVVSIKSYDGSGGNNKYELAENSQFQFSSDGNSWRMIELDQSPEDGFDSVWFLQAPDEIVYLKSSMTNWYGNTGSEVIKIDISEDGTSQPTEPETKGAKVVFEYQVNDNTFLRGAFIGSDTSGENTHMALIEYQDGDDIILRAFRELGDDNSPRYSVFGYQAFSSVSWNSDIKDPTVNDLWLAAKPATMESPTVIIGGGIDNRDEWIIDLEIYIKPPEDVDGDEWDYNLNFSTEVEIFGEPEPLNKSDNDSEIPEDDKQTHEFSISFSGEYLTKNSKNSEPSFRSRLGNFENFKSDYYSATEGFIGAISGTTSGVYGEFKFDYENFLGGWINKIKDRLSNEINKIKDKINHFSNKIKSRLIGFINKGKAYFNRLKDKVKGYLDKAKNYVKELVSKAKGFLEKGKQWLKGILGKAKGFWDKAKSFGKGLLGKAKALWDKLKDKMKGFWDKAKSFGKGLLGKAKAKGKGLIDKAKNYLNKRKVVAKGFVKGLLGKAKGYLGKAKVDINDSLKSYGISIKGQMENIDVNYSSDLGKLHNIDAPAVGGISTPDELDVDAPDVVVNIEAIAGNSRTTPAAKKEMLAGGLSYLLRKIDIVPDYLTGVGTVDDEAVLGAVVPEGVLDVIANFTYAPDEFLVRSPEDELGEGEYNVNGTFTLTDQDSIPEPEIPDNVTYFNSRIGGRIYNGITGKNGRLMNGMQANARFSNGGKIDEGILNTSIITNPAIDKKTELNYAWWGYCNGWTSASTMESEPVNSINIYEPEIDRSFEDLLGNDLGDVMPFSISNAANLVEIANYAPEDGSPEDGGNRNYFGAGISGKISVFDSYSGFINGIFGIINVTRADEGLKEINSDLTNYGSNVINISKTLFKSKTENPITVMFNPEKISVKKQIPWKDDSREPPGHNGLENFTLNKKIRYDNIMDNDSANSISADPTVGISLDVKQTRFNHKEKSNIDAIADIGTGRGPLKLGGSLKGKYENDLINIESGLNLRNNFEYQQIPRVSKLLSEVLEVKVDPSKFKPFGFDVKADLDINTGNSEILKIDGKIDGKYEDGSHVNLDPDLRLNDDFNYRKEPVNVLFAVNNSATVTVKPSKFKVADIALTELDVNIPGLRKILKLKGMADSGAYESGKGLSFDGTLSVPEPFSYEKAPVTATLVIENSLTIKVEESNFNEAKLSQINVNTDVKINGTDLKLDGNVDGKIEDDYKIDFYGTISVKNDFSKQFEDEVTTTLKNGGSLSVQVEKNKFEYAELVSMTILTDIDIPDQNLELEGSVEGEIHEDYQVSFDGSISLSNPFEKKFGDSVSATLKTGGELEVDVKKSGFTYAEIQNVNTEVNIEINDSVLNLQGNMKGKYGLKNDSQSGNKTGYKTSMSGGSLSAVNLSKIRPRTQVGSEIKVLFNPKEFTVEKTVPWQEHHNTGLDIPEQKFASGKSLKVDYAQWLDTPDNNQSSTGRKAPDPTESKLDDILNNQNQLAERSVKSMLSIGSKIQVNDITGLITRDLELYTKLEEYVKELETGEPRERSVDKIGFEWMVDEGLPNQMMLMQSFTYSGMEMAKNDNTIAGDKYATENNNNFAFTTYASALNYVYQKTLVDYSSYGVDEDGKEHPELLKVNISFESGPLWEMDSPLNNPILKANISFTMSGLGPIPMESGSFSGTLQYILNSPNNDNKTITVAGYELFHRLTRGRNSRSWLDRGQSDNESSGSQDKSITQKDTGDISTGSGRSGARLETRLAASCENGVGMLNYESEFPLNTIRNSNGNFADQDTFWTRISSFMSGGDDQRGFFNLPEVDDEVVVAFAGGDEKTPFVIGSLWNDKVLGDSTGIVIYNMTPGQKPVQGKDIIVKFKSQDPNHSADISIKMEIQNDKVHNSTTIVIKIDIYHLTKDDAGNELKKLLRSYLMEFGLERQRASVEDMPILFAEDFEDTGCDIYTNLESDWDVGDPTLGLYGPFSAAEGTYCMATKIFDSYSRELSSLAWTPVIDLTGTNNVILSFKHYFYTEEGYDGGRVIVSVDSGQSWNLIYPEGGYTSIWIAALNGPGFSGISDLNYGWKEVKFDLSQFCGQQIQIAWNFISDASVEYDGWYIDDISINGS